MRTYEGKCMVTWDTDNEGNRYWTCTHQWLNCGRHFKPSAETCYHYKCPSRREDPLKNRIIPPKLTEIEEPKSEEVEVAICAWFRCDQPVAPNKLRHCSEVCRKRQNRWDYKQRQKAKRNEVS